MQNILSDFRIFIDTGYFPGAFGFIFVYALLTLVSLGLSHVCFLSRCNRI